MNEKEILNALALAQKTLTKVESEADISGVLYETVMSFIDDAIKAIEYAEAEINIFTEE